MAIDYQSYGFSGSGSDDIRLLEPDPTTDAPPVTEKQRRLLLKRTNLNNAHEVADFRAAVSFLQGEPGVDPERIGIWGSSNGGSVVVAVAAVDARVRRWYRRCPRRGPRRAVRWPIAAPTARGRDRACAHGTGRGSRRRLLVQEQDRRCGRTSATVTCGQARRSTRFGRRTAVLFSARREDELTGGAGGAIEASKFL